MKPNIHSGRTFVGPLLALSFALTGCEGSVGPGTGSGSGSIPPGPGGGQPPGVPGEDPELPPSPPGAAPDLAAQAPLRRLTRVQYANAVRDLLGIETDVTEAFAQDEKGGGFASNFKAPVVELQVESYRAAAEELAAQAVQDLTVIAPCATGGDEAGCLNQFLQDFGTRAYRRPLSVEEAERYRQLFQVGKGTTGTFADGLSLVISTMLQSGHFLYRVELGNAVAATPTDLPLSQYELASRLSFLLQNSIPDAELLAAAANNQLATTEQIAAQSRRLLASPAARDTFISFYEQWMQLEDLPFIQKDEELYPDFTPELRTAMEAEAREFVDYVMRQGDARLATLLTANFSFVSGPLYDLYGVQVPPGASRDVPTMVTLPAGQRAGAFTLASVMTRHSHPDQSSPVARGFIVSETLLCFVPPEPPQDLEIEVPSVDSNLPTRVRFEEHRANPACASCHQYMDPIGLTFENYDATGRYRLEDADVAVDASSMLSAQTNLEAPPTDRVWPDGTIPLTVTNAAELMNTLATSDTVRACMARQWYRYTFGRPDTKLDEGAIATALQAFAASDYKIPELLVALTTTRGFRYRLPIAVQ